MRFAFSSLVALATAALAVAQPSTDLNTGTAHSVDHVAPPTNAKRLAAGLPPLPPRAHRRQPHRGTKVDSARRSGASPVPPAIIKCNILVKDAATGNANGYIRPEWYSSLGYYTVGSGPAGALEVSFDASGSLSQLDLAVATSIDFGVSFLGATMSYFSTNDDLSTTTGNYAWITGTARTPPGSPPILGENSVRIVQGSDQPMESAIWKYDPVTQELTAQWLNRNGPPAPSYLVQVGSELYMTGNVALLSSRFNRPDFYAVTYTCVPPLTVV